MLGFIVVLISLASAGEGKMNLALYHHSLIGITEYQSVMKIGVLLVKKVRWLF